MNALFKFTEPVSLRDLAPSLFSQALGTKVCLPRGLMSRDPTAGLQPGCDVSVSSLNSLWVALLSLSLQELDSGLGVCGGLPVPSGARAHGDAERRAAWCRDPGGFGASCQLTRRPQSVAAERSPPSCPPPHRRGWSRSRAPQSRCSRRALLVFAALSPLGASGGGQRSERGRAGAPSTGGNVTAARRARAPSLGILGGGQGGLRPRVPHGAQRGRRTLELVGLGRGWGTDCGLDVFAMSAFLSAAHRKHVF